MKVLLTGASGFVGSHILDSLRQHKLETVLLLRDSSPGRFISQNLSDVQVCRGSISDSDSLNRAVQGVTHIIHCAGCTKALSKSGFYQTNVEGTANLIAAINKNSPSLQRLLLISSLAACGPATPEAPAREHTPPHPVSTYGQSKLAAEMVVREKCAVPFTILRPPAVYGPRDSEFLSIFQAVRNHLLPRPSKRQALSLVYVKDLAETVVSCLTHSKTAGRMYFVSSPEIVTGRDMANEIAAQMGRWTLPLPIPRPALWTVCLAQEIISRLTGRANVLSLQKYAELRAPGWVCSPAKLLEETGLSCKTGLSSGISQTLLWYKGEHWL